jgi:hypothetical protein
LCKVVASCFKESYQQLGKKRVENFSGKPANRLLNAKSHAAHPDHIYQTAAYFYLTLRRQSFCYKSAAGGYECQLYTVGVLRIVQVDPEPVWTW